MTKSTITRDELNEVIATYGKHHIAHRMANLLLAAMDSEPVAVIDHANLDYLRSGADADVWPPEREEMGDVLLYRHAQPAPVVKPVMFIDGDISSEDADKLAKVIREFNEEDERPLAKMARIIRENPHPTNECDMPKAQPAPVVPEDVRQALSKMDDEIIAELDAEESACRAAMLQAEPVCTCPSGDGSLRWPCPVHPGSSPVIPDGYVMVPVEPNGDMLAAAQDAYGETDGDIASTLRAAMLAAAPEVNHG